MMAEYFLKQQRIKKALNATESSHFISSNFSLFRHVKQSLGRHNFFDADADENVKLPSAW
jgi:hypothetical protein